MTKNNHLINNRLARPRSQKWKVLSILFLITFALIGGYLTYQSFAYKTETCKGNFGFYQYSPDCVKGSDEAKVVRLYYSVFNRKPDKSGLEYWTKQLNGENTAKRKWTLGEVTENFISSSEFKSNFKNLSNKQFVEKIYLQAIGRAADSSGLQFFTQKLNNKEYTRSQVVLLLSESTENKNRSIDRVVAALGISLKSPNYHEFDPGKISCLGAVEKIGSDKWCTKKLSDKKRFALVKLSRKYKDSHLVSTRFTAQLLNTPSNVNLGLDSATDISHGGFGTFYYLSDKLSAQTATYYATPSVVTPIKLDNSARAYEVNKTMYAGTKNQLITFNVSGHGQNILKFAPSNAKIGVKLSSIKTYSLKYNDKYQNRYAADTGRRLRLINTGTKFQTYVTGKNYTISEKQPYIDVNEKSGSTDWVQSSTTTIKNGVSYFGITGGVNNEFNAANNYNVKFKIKVYKNGQTVSSKFYEVATTYLSTSGSNHSVLKNTAGYYTLKRDLDPFDDISVSLNQKSPGKLKFEIDVISAPSNYKFIESSIITPDYTGGRGAAQGYCAC